ncbi:MAG: DUF1638 domain-containing protein [Pseudomonadota bacterium]
MTGAASPPKTLLIACGALAREMLALIEANRWSHLTLECLPAKLHNRPEKIPDAVRDKIAGARGRFERIFVAYADCGTGGLLDKVLAEEGVERIGGPHCYSFYAGADAFEALHEEELGSFYLTDYLARHFETLIIKGMGLDRFPELMEAYFGNYRRLVFLAQTEDAELVEKAKAAAARLGLDYEYRLTGYGELTDFMTRAAGAQKGTKGNG